MNLRLDWCSYQAAKYAVEHWHYSKTMPVGKMMRIGVWEDGQFRGCILFSRGASHYLGTVYGVKCVEVAELSRVALTTHKTPVSKCIAVALRMIKAAAPGLKLIISFADTAQSHMGIIYQASNWVYTGCADMGGAKQYAVGGRILHSRTMGSLFGTRSAKFCEANGIVAMPPSPKHRYLMPLDDEMRQRIEPLRKPYPKRVGSRDNAAPAIHAGEGGVIPTPALQEVSNG